jgi:hypothetical protein
MTAQIAFNPLLTTNGLGGFSTSSDGFVQGVAMDDPAVRYALSGGILSVNETIPMWGGVGIYENIPALGLDGALGGQVGRAASISALTGFSVFNQAHAWVTSPQSPVPVGASGQTVSFYRLGSGARIPVKCDPALVSLDGNLITQQVSWDFTGQQLIQYNAQDAQVNITSLTWNAGVVTLVSASPHGRAVGDWITVSGAIPAAYNGDYQVQTAADATHLTYVLAANPGAETTPGVILAGGGALPCKILLINQGNSKVVAYDPLTNFATWNNQGTCALIQI